MLKKVYLERFVATLKFVVISTLILRLFFAYEWLNSGIDKLQEITDDSQAYFTRMQNIIGNVWTEGTQTIMSNPYPFMVDFLKNVASPNAAMFLSLVIVAEVSLGICYLFGFLVRPAAAVGMFLNLTFFFATGHSSPAAAGVNIIMFGGQLFMLMVSAGRAYGLDAMLSKRFPKFHIF